MQDEFIIMGKCPRKGCHGVIITPKVLTDETKKQKPYCSVCSHTPTIRKG